MFLRGDERNETNFTVLVQIDQQQGGRTPEVSIMGLDKGQMEEGALSG